MVRLSKKLQKLRDQTDIQLAENFKRKNELLDKGDFLDEDEYPTDDALEIIKLWHFDDARGWFKFIEGIWSNCGRWTEKDMPKSWASSEMDHVYDIATGGWSGNESIIHAMQDNLMMWALNWYQSTRGGHYIFTLKEFNDGS